MAINSTQAYQMAAALAPSFLANVPQSTQRSSLEMQVGTAQGGIQSELYKKALKKQNSGNGTLDQILSVASMIPGPQQPFVMGANAINKGINGDWGGAVAGAAGAAGGMGNMFGSGGGGGSTAPGIDMNVTTGEPDSVGAVLSNAEATPADSSSGTIAPSSSESEASVTGIKPAAAAAVGGAAVAAMGHAKKMQDEHMMQESRMNEALQDVSDPRQRMLLAHYTSMSPTEWKGMKENEAMVAGDLLAKSGIPLTGAQSRALPSGTRHSLQQTYGPELVPMTTFDRLSAFSDAYNKKYGNSSLISPYPGLEVYIP